MGINDVPAIIQCQDCDETAIWTGEYDPSNYDFLDYRYRCTVCGKHTVGRIFREPEIMIFVLEPTDNADSEV